MSQVLEVSSRGGELRAYEDEGSEFSYKPVLGLSILAVMMAVVSVFALVFWALIPLALLGAGVAAVSLIQLYRAAGEYRGFVGSWFALATCVLMFVGGIGVQVHAYQTEVPDGFERLNFSADISKKGIVYQQGYMMPHPDVAALDGKKVFLKGFVYPEKQQVGLKGFLFCRDAGDCCFGGNPKPEDRIGVIMTGDKTVDFYPARVSVAGTFRLNRNYKGGDKEPIYLMDGEVYTPAQSDF